MARGLRKDTLDRIAAARARSPLSLGPYLGELVVGANITASAVAKLVGAHEQTVFRWFFGQGEVQPVWGVKVGQLIAFFAWLHVTHRVPLNGTSVEREIQLRNHSVEYNNLARAGEKNNTAA